MIIRILVLGILGAANLLGQGLMVPGKSHTSKDAATLNVPVYLAPLGALRTDLIAYFSMDSLEMGGLAWSRMPIGIKREGPVQVIEKEGRRYFDFSNEGSALRFERSYPTGTRYTFCVWVQFPAPVKYAVVWGGDKGDMLSLEKMRILVYDYRDAKGKDLARTQAPITGWHHLALTYDGTKVQGFFDGKALGTVDGLPGVNMATIGNHRVRTKYDMCAGLDDQFIFGRALKPEEIETVMNFKAEVPAGLPPAASAPVIIPVTPAKPAVKPPTNPVPAIPVTPPKPRDPNAPNPFGESR